MSQTSATLVASVKPGFSLTTYFFEFGTTNAYGASTVKGGPIGADDASHSVNAVLTGLTAGMTYHFRAVAVNEFGMTEGPDETFKTPRAEEPTKAEPPLTCKKGSVRKHGRCVKKPHHVKRHKQSGHSGGRTNG